MTERAKGKVGQAQDVLHQLEFDRERTNERSALVLLALLDLRPRGSWRKVKAPMLRTIEIMDWIAERYDKNYKPNTRETIRRQTLHQFVDAGLVALNPDDPKRAVNSPNNCYQVTDLGVRTLSSYGTPSWSRELRTYLDALPGLKKQYAKARKLKQIPVKLPGGAKIALTPGGQNVLIKEIVEKFCPRFTPGGEVLYVGDAGKSDPVLDEGTLDELGVSLDKHGKLPDLLVHMRDRGWLVLMEAASSHGPVDSKRHGELSNLFSNSTSNLAFVSCFPDRGVMRAYLSDIAWETDVWCAEDPDHLIHFNGERFLGPY